MRIGKFLYFGDFLAIPLLVAIFLRLALHAQGLAGLPEFGLSFASGLVVWTLAEYLIHRFLYHRAPWLSELHELHHKAPMELIGLPSFVSSGIVVLLTYGPFFAFAPVFAAGFATGGLIGYAAYMMVHHATHHWRLEPGDWLYPARVRHLAHHYREEANYGIVTAFWDHIFGTVLRRRSA
jgi:sterol desaturase/sphingolipid hydroxylase (fatty acid hydroxylase superfamily)